ncbi:MAG: Rrf2 family transcriptional regulator [Peptococcaceae bacterium]|jgi:Rrf2 family protein|nr:Rrf2 family transcriptional regulator [Peptococcaceae bacterium]
MFLTKECDYAVRVVRSLLDMEMKPVKLICVEEHIPAPFAYKILKKLEHAGIVKSHRGSAGGYQLLRDPNGITLLDIVSAVDDHLLLNECLQDGYVCENNEHGSLCSVHIELSRLQSLLVVALQEKPMSKLV